MKYSIKADDANTELDCLVSLIYFVTSQVFQLMSVFVQQTQFALRF